MSIADFGQNVEEVRRKLSEILPLVDAGQHAIEEVHTTFSSDIGELESHLDSLTESFQSLDELADDFHQSLDQSQTSLTQAVESLQNDLESVGATLDSLESGLSEAQEELQSTLDAAREGLEEVESQLQSELTNVQQDIEQLRDGFEQFGNSVQEQIAQVVQDAQEFSTDIKADLDQTFESLSGFMNSAEEVGTSLTEKLQGLGDSVQTTISTLTEQVTNHQGSVTEFFGMFGSDTENLLNEGKNALAEVFEQLGTTVQHDVGEALSDIVHSAVETCVQALASEIVENGVMIEVGVATTSALSPVLPEIVAAQKLVELIDMVL